MSSVAESLMGKLFSKRKKSAGSSRPASAAAAAAFHSKEDEHAGYGDTNFPEVTLQHSDAVVSVAAVKPGYCLSGSKDMCIILYDYRNKRQDDRWTGHTSAVTKVWYGEACNGVFSTSRDKTIKMWCHGSHQCIREFLGHSLVVTAIHLNSDNSHLCSGSRDNAVKLWDVESATCIRTNSIPQNLVTDVKFVPSTSHLVQTGEDKEVRVFDTRNLQPVFSFPKKQYIQMCCDISVDGYYVLSSSNGFSGNGCEATLWDLRARKLLCEYKGHHEAVEACLFLPGTDHPMVATASRDCSVKVWNMHTGVQESECYISGSGPLTALTAYSDGSILVGSFNKGVQILQLHGTCLTQVMHY